jgi:uncharacterized protein YndB with AHSA1/START domain
MSEPGVSVELTRRLAAPPERVFDAWLDPETLGRWLFATAGGRMERIAVDARVGGRFEIDERRGDELARHWGIYVEIDRPRRLAFDFGTSFEAAPTRVTVTIVPDGDGSLLTLRHEGVWSDWADRTRHGWGMILGNLETTLAG